MLNVQQIINGYNQTVLKNSAKPTQDHTGKACNCRKKEECPLEGNCLSKLKESFPRFMLQKPEISAGLMGHLARMQA